jgi:ribosomal subunit interface protein
MKVHVAVKGLELTGELEKYVHRKLARLNRKAVRRLRAQASYEISLTQTTRRGTKYSTCSMVLTLGEQECIAKETTLHLHAAVDVAAAQIEQQLKLLVRPRRHRFWHR